MSLKHIVCYLFLWLSFRILKWSPKLRYEILVAPLLIVALRVLSYTYTYQVNVPLGETSLLALNTQSLETWQCKADGSSHGSLVVPIELAITCIIFVSDHQLLNKLLSVLGSGLKTKHTCSQRECKQDARLWYMEF